MNSLVQRDSGNLYKQIADPYGKNPFGEFGTDIQGLEIQGQADAPSMEITLNFVASDWADESTNILGSMVGDGIQHVFRFTLMNAAPTGSGATKFASTSGGVGTVQNSQYYWIGKLEALLVNPQLTDANTATITITVQSDFYGAYTV